MGDLKEEQRTVAKGTFWSIAGGMGVKFISFFYTVIIARLFSQGDIGTFFLAFSIMYVATTLSDLGVSMSLPRYIPFYLGKKQMGKAYNLLTSSYVFSGAISIIVASLLYLFSGPLAWGFGNAALSPVLQIIAVFIVVNQVFSINTYFLLGLKRVKENNFLNNLQNLLKLVLTAALFFIMGADGIVLPIAFLASYILTTAASQLYVLKEVGRLELRGITVSLRDRFDMMREIIPFGFTLSLISATWLFIYNTDRVMIGYLLPSGIASSEISVYTMASSLASILIVFPLAVNTIFFPMISELYGKGKNADILRLSNSSAQWIAMLAAPFTIIMLVFPEEMLRMFYGASYAPGAAVAAIFAVGLFIRSLSYVQSYILATLKLVKIEFYVAGLAAIVNIILNWVLIPSYGIEGAAMAFAVSISLVTALMTYYSNRFFGFRLRNEFYKSIAGFALALAVMFALKGHIDIMFQAFSQINITGSGFESLILQKFVKLLLIGILFLLSCAVYFVALSVLRAFREEDASVMSGALRRAGFPKQVISLVQSLMGFRLR